MILVGFCVSMMTIFKSDNNNNYVHKIENQIVLDQSNFNLPDLHTLHIKRDRCISFSSRETIIL